MSTKIEDVELLQDKEKLNTLLDEALFNYVNRQSKNLAEKLIWILHKNYKRLLIFLIFRLKILSVKTVRRTFWGEAITMIGVRPYSL